MTSRTARKSPALPIKESAAALSINYVRELPGAVFFGPVDPESLTYAARLQQIRSEYENDDCQEMLWADLSAMGFDSSEIRRFVANPAAITNCGYGMPTVALR
ncbi:hypothetical protein SAMN05443247_07630 [Bradyrhizobium erythrophlei]|nr:hypothetical protein SAMN05443247_07630 [Bradyrhizobium erythrophlei]